MLDDRSPERDREAVVVLLAVQPCRGGEKQRSRVTDDRACGHEAVSRQVGIAARQQHKRFADRGRAIRMRPREEGQGGECVTGESIRSVERAVVRQAEAGRGRPRPRDVSHPGVAPGDLPRERCLRLIARPTGIATQELLGVIHTPQAH